MKDIRRVWWTPWRYAAPVDWEHFMEKMAKEGWNVDRIRQSSSFCMVFRKTEPKQYRYVMDLNPFPKSDYIATFEAFGWEFAGKMASAYIWRKEYQEKRPEAFSSRESRGKKIDEHHPCSDLPADFNAFRSCCCYSSKNRSAGTAGRNGRFLGSYPNFWRNGSNTWSNFTKNLSKKR